ncbi:hypothetical protein [Pontibacter actiniarum]|uniref:Uncharacterized protein n=1 Tax=Pontibacter actiniarum TaxID=323450 RepID=A0A1X9YWN3_9BACT|nr:hypothetical protein [Pontibacter actiniarum]ARS37268.1 hypothetical protein CA264_18585 [Pontibacter actiniarum]
MRKIIALLLIAVSAGCQQENKTYQVNVLDASGSLRESYVTSNVEYDGCFVRFKDSISEEEYSLSGNIEVKEL